MIKHQGAGFGARFILYMQEGYYIFSLNQYILIYVLAGAGFAVFI
jgi:hypothetical protein